MYNFLHEDSTIADLKDIVNIAQGAASADDYSYSSIAKAASNLTAIFPILVSKTVSGETARIVSKFIEQKACTLFMLGLQQANVDTARDGIAHFKKFHQNLKGSDNRRSAFKPIVDFLKIYTKVTAESVDSTEEFECECDSLLEADDIEVNAQALKGLMESLAKAPNIQFYDTQLNPVSINDFGVKETDGNYRVTIRGIDSLHEETRYTQYTTQNQGNSPAPGYIDREDFAAQAFLSRWDYSSKNWRQFRLDVKDEYPAMYQALSKTSDPNTRQDLVKKFFQQDSDAMNILDRINNKQYERKRQATSDELALRKDEREMHTFNRNQDPYRYDLKDVQDELDKLNWQLVDGKNANGGRLTAKERREIETRISDLKDKRSELNIRHKNELDKEELTNDKLRAEIRGADAKRASDIARANYDRLKYQMDIDTALAQVGGRHAEILKDQDIKKMNDAVPSLLVVKFRRPDSIAYTEYLIGVKAKLLPVTTEEVIRRIINDNKDGKKFLKFMRTITGELRLSNALFALSRMKEDLKSTRVRGTYGDTWNLLKNRAEAARISVKFGQQNDFSAITTVLISKADADDLFRQENIDITKEKETLHFMSSYNLLAFIIVDDATETMKIMFDDGTKQFEEVSYTMLERDSASSYKKVVDLMSTFK